MKRFMKKNCKRQIKHNLGSKKEQRKKLINCVWIGKAMIINSIAGLIKKDNINESIFS